MAGIATSTVAQVEEARRRIAQLLPLLQELAQGPFSPTTLASGQIAEIDLAVDNAVAALGPINT
jgi:hypothetical protein